MKILSLSIPRFELVSDERDWPLCPIAPRQSISHITNGNWFPVCIHSNNGLFIAAAVHCFQHNHLAAGIIFTSFEAGWYFGGIYGAGEEAKTYNERLYEKKITPLMNQKGLFPVFMLQYGF